MVVCIAGKQPVRVDLGDGRGRTPDSGGQQPGQRAPRPQGRPQAAPPRASALTPSLQRPRARPRAPYLTQEDEPLVAAGAVEGRPGRQPRVRQPCLRGKANGQEHRTAGTRVNQREEETLSFFLLTDCSRSSQCSAALSPSLCFSHGRHCCCADAPDGRRPLRERPAIAARPGPPPPRTFRQSRARSPARRPRSSAAQRRLRRPWRREEREGEGRVS